MSALPTAHGPDVSPDLISDDAALDFLLQQIYNQPTNKAGHHFSKRAHVLIQSSKSVPKREPRFLWAMHARLSLIAPCCGKAAGSLLVASGLAALITLTSVSA